MTATTRRRALAPRPALAPSTLARVPDAELEAMRHALIREGANAPADVNRAVPVHIRRDLTTIAEEQAARYLRRNPDPHV